MGHSEIVVTGKGITPCAGGGALLYLGK